ncbi:MAG: DUF4102 domain-containing protein [Proteobacteria bacterium]|nr:DUF4102 domain-containing protein [Pseudomonadota bacterium]
MAQPIMSKLTDLQCKNAKPRERAYILSDGLGLYLEIAPTGGKLWRFKYQWMGKQKRVAMGSYPETSIADAREKRHEARSMVAKSIDPAARKKEIKQAKILEHQNTFEAVAKLWYAKKSQDLSPRYAEQTWARIQADLLPQIGSKPITAITPLDIIRALKRVEARGVHELAYRLKQHCGEIFRYAVVYGIAKHNPVKDFESRDVLSKYKKSHFASIEPKELPEFLAALRSNKARLYKQTQLAIELMLLTFVRTSELIKAKWDEINFEEAQWTVPAGRMKMRRIHIVPLSTQAVEHLRELQKMNHHSEFVFPGVFNHRITMSNNTILQALAGMGYKGRMTGHGFRSLAMSTIKERLNYRHEVIDLQLAHAKANKIQAAYDRAQFLSERRKMMQDWADYLDSLGREGKK